MSVSNSERHNASTSVVQRGNRVQAQKARGDNGPPIPRPFSGMSRLVPYVTDTEDRRDGDVEVFLTQEAYRQVMDHLCGDTSRERGGILYGHIYEDQNGFKVATIVEEAVAAPHSRGQLTRVAFPEKTWAELGEMEDERREKGWAGRRVGWYHSHPNFGLFLSAHDLDVCSVFENPGHVALVVDPVRHLGGFFVRGSDGFRQDSPQGFWEVGRTENTVVRWGNCMPAGTETNEVIFLPEGRKPEAPTEMHPSPQSGDEANAEAAVAAFTKMGLAALLILAVVLGPYAWAMHKVDRIERQVLTRLERNHAAIGQTMRRQGELVLQADANGKGLNQIIERLESESNKDNELKTVAHDAPSNLLTAFLITTLRRFKIGTGVSPSTEEHVPGHSDRPPSLDDEPAKRPSEQPPSPDEEPTTRSSEKPPSPDEEAVKRTSENPPSPDEGPEKRTSEKPPSPDEEAAKRSSEKPAPPDLNAAEAVENGRRVRANATGPR